MNPGSLLLCWLDVNEFFRKVDWIRVDQLVPIAEAIAGVTIWINGVALTGAQDKFEYRFGRLFTSDIVELFRDTQSGSKCVCRLQCNFYHQPASQRKKKDFMVEEFIYSRETHTFLIKPL